jgi:hypothetical protein
MQDTTGSKIVFYLGILVLFLSLCTALAQAGTERAAQGRPAGILLMLERLPALLPHTH